MSYLKPHELAEAMVEAGASKVGLSAKDTLIRAYMAGAILALAAGFAVTVTVNTGNPLIGALLFPVGFCMLSLLGFDLLTGVFTLVPFAVLTNRPGCTPRAMLRTWALVFAGNFLGAMTTAIFMATILTMGFTQEAGDVGQKLRTIGEARTLGYAEAGLGGMTTLFIRAVMCNWMVSTGVVAAIMSTSVSGKVIAMWMPILIFFYLGFEHSVVNMFLFPAGLLLGAGFTWADYLLYNEIPTVLGNLAGGITFVGATIYSTYYRHNGTSPETAVDAPLENV
ncbi:MULTISPECIES: formate/nitrite transporter family protein [unclassified Leisingera]|uniref:formate/nitrite transporter family protein n=1 Tax=unclassified Leisingera TaxID=2614906 RepID=UPI001010C00C|nr:MULTISPECIES: formate/nitrite transporter family protein [unclassified Leisingera]MBQ4825849.1 formate/nitrite transporter family protein [Leisingera sp. HS039]MCF6431184.1 formate/nitrite transporter family protein [Leisingera sp. MMG026]QAX32201.1 formate/nitrite transporter family protein [Leisingera sp. NJS204]QBR38807.1 formate/nitrite transporter family protein [Leisingera sp. NJS201]